MGGGVPTVAGSGHRWRIGGSLAVTGGAGDWAGGSARGGSTVRFGCGGTAESNVSGRVSGPTGDTRGPGNSVTTGGSGSAGGPTAATAGKTGGSAVTGTGRGDGLA